jgi:hypothetical protein
VLRDLGVIAVRGNAGRNIALANTYVLAAAYPDGVYAAGLDVAKVDCKKRAPVVPGAFNP